MFFKTKNKCYDIIIIIMDKIISKKIVIKLSGESFASNNENFDFTKIEEFAKQISLLVKEDYKIGVIIGGGNIWRDSKNNNAFIKRNESDYIGMLSTLLNGLTLEQVLKNKFNVKTNLFSSIEVPLICEKYNKDIVQKQYLKGNVLIFAGGVGWPHFTTDTAAALRASELYCDVLLMAKNGVDGVYNKDPKHYSDVKRFNKITYDEILKQEIGIMDKTAILLCKKNNIKTYIFSANEKDGIINVLKNQAKYTIISNNI